MTHIMLTGQAGTGKSTTAIKTALKSGKKIHIIRSLQATGVGIGFLPGDVDEKIRPFFDIYKPIFDKIEVGMMQKLLSARKLSFHPTAFLRGMTFEECEVILDEYQQLTIEELSTVVTRIGKGSRLIVCGDTDQSDLPSHLASDAYKFTQIFTKLPHVKHIHLTENFRAGIVADYLKALREYPEGPEFLHRSVV